MHLKISEEFQKIIDQDSLVLLKKNTLTVKETYLLKRYLPVLVFMIRPIKSGETKSIKNNQNIYLILYGLII